MTISLDLAITAIRANRREEGRQLLNLLIQQNPNDEMAWLWMSEVVEKDEQRSRCLFHVLAINPDSTVARQGLQRLGIEISASRPVTVEVASETKPVAASAADERHPKRLDPKAITQAMPFTPLGETPADGETGRKKELSNTKQRLRLLTKALMEHESPPVEAVPLPDFDAALAQVKQLPLEKTILLAPSKPMKLPLSGHASRPIPMGHLGYAAPSQPMHPVQPGFYAPNMFTQLTRPSQPVAMSQAHTLGMPFQSQQIPVIHANTTMGMPYSAPLAYGGVGFHSNATLGMPMPVNAYPPQPQSGPSDRELIAAYQATSQPLRRAPQVEYEEEGEPINIVAVFIFGFLAITALGGAGILILLFMTTWTQ